ncbi:TPA: hypothetical protein ACH3X1_008905 [Trebouxia sp. C0004]
MKTLAVPHAPCWHILICQTAIFLPVVQWQYTPNFDKPLWVVCFKRTPGHIVSPFRLWTTVRLMPLPPVLLLTVLIATKCLPASVALQQYLSLCRLARAS